MPLPFPTGHRPYPPPRRPWLLAMSWRDLLFAHWSMSPDALRRSLPAGLPLDTWEGRAFLGVVPFCVRGARPRLLPPLPGLSSFLELNVRTYVTIDGKPGVYFFSLDASSPIAVRMARHLMHLQYRDARMHARDDGGWIEYQSARTDRKARGDARLQARYRPIGGVQLAPAGSLTAWLTERYCMYMVDKEDRVYRGEIHHAPWPLQPAEAAFSVNTMAAPLGHVLCGPPLLHFVRRHDMVGWGPERV